MNISGRFKHILRFHEKPSVSEELSILLAYANRSMSAQKYLEAYFLYSEAFSLRQDSNVLLMLTECKRLIGLENRLTSKFITSDINDFIGCFGPKWTLDNLEYQLRVNRDSKKKLIESVIKNDKIDKNGPITEQLIGNGVDPKQLSKDFKKYKVIKDLRNIAASETIIHNTYTEELPRIDVAYSDRLFEQIDHTIHVKNGSVFQLFEGSCYEGSEAIIFNSEECVYVDSLTYDTNRIVNFKNDSRIVGCYENYIFLDENLISETYDFDTIFWLASPMSHEWGHWVNECLIKLAYFCKLGFSNTTPVLISEGVPQSFISITNIIFPTINFRKIKKNSRITFKRLYYVPSRVFGPSNLHWSINYGPLRVNQEPESSKLLKSFIDRIRLEKIFSEKIFLDRVKTANRVSSQIGELRKIVKSKGYETIDPGLLNPIEELSLFKYGLKFSGFMGSQFLLGISTSNQSQFSILHHDSPGDFRGFAWALQPRKCTWYLGERDIVIPGYGDLISHRVHTSSSELLTFFAENI